MNIAAQIIGLVASAVMIGSIQVKNKKNLYLILNIFVKILYGINFAMLAAYSGTATQLIGLIITVIAYLYSKKNIDIPKWLIGVFIIVTVVMGVFTYKDIYSLIPIVCGITYALIVVSKNMKSIRKLNLAQSFLWTAYNLIITAYTASISSAFVFISTIIAIKRYDMVEEINGDNL